MIRLNTTVILILFFHSSFTQNCWKYTVTKTWKTREAFCCGEGGTFPTPSIGFESKEKCEAAALGKKKVQLIPVMDKDLADYVITGTSLDKKAGWAKIVFMGNVHSDNAASITMSDRKTGAIVYAYAVDKKSTMHGQQTTAEACAKHLQAHIEGKE